MKSRLRTLLRSAPDVDPQLLKKALPASLEEIARKFKTTEGRALDALRALSKSGLMVREVGGTWELLSSPPPMEMSKARHHVVGPEYRFGVISDTHYGSKYAREDVVDDLYDWYASEGIERVYHCGNWIDGEARFNRYELLDDAHGMQAQVEMFVKRYPTRKGIRTFYVAGDDHEGWYQQRESIEIGQFLENVARREERKDLVYLGYKEAFITLEHPKTKKHAHLLVDHPGGGSAYATSYAPQKRVEALQSGEKPAVWLFGHWHKLGYFWERGVHVMLAGCTKDLDLFGRKKGLRYHLGGSIIEMRQDEGGAIVEFTPRIRTYFDRAYHQGTSFALSRGSKK